MSADRTKCMAISKSGVLAFGTGLPVLANIQSFFQDDPVTHVACGKAYSAVVCESGKVYTFGKFPDIGFTENKTDLVSEPRLIATLGTVKVTRAACGEQFIIFLTDKGLLYSWGLNASGQLGLGHTDTSPSPALVTGLPPIKKVATGLDHTVALDDSGNVWVTGNNSDGELGLGHTVNQTSFTCVPDLPESITDISCGSWYTALLSTSQGLLTTGYNGNGQLGRPSYKKSRLHKFKPILKKKPAIAAMSCGGYHIAVLYIDGTISSWGYNGFGQFGTGKTAFISTSVKMIGLENITITEVIAGHFHTALLTSEGDVLVCGRGQGDKLGEGNVDILVPTLLPKSPRLVVRQVAFAETYSLMLVAQNPNKVTTSPWPAFEGAFQGDQPRGCATFLRRSLSQSLSCPVCLKVMSAPIHLCGNGLLCIASRTKALDAVPNTRQGVCVHLPHHFTHSTALEHMHTDVLVGHGQVFKLHRRFIKTTGQFQAILRYIGPPENKCLYKLEIKFIVDDDEIIFRRNVCADIEPIEDSFSSPNSVLMETTTVNAFLQGGCLVGQVAILNLESNQT